MAVAISGTSMEKIPLPLWFTRLRRFPLAPDVRLRTGFFVARDLFFIERVDFMLA